ncbi:hypothetical protein Emed_000628 [Eimeria media]
MLFLKRRARRQREPTKVQFPTHRLRLLERVHITGIGPIGLSPLRPEATVNPGPGGGSIICCVALLALFIMCLCITIREVQTERRLAEDNRQRQQELKEKREMQAARMAANNQNIQQASKSDWEDLEEPLASGNHELPEPDQADETSSATEPSPKLRGGATEGNPASS